MSHACEQIKHDKAVSTLAFIKEKLMKNIIFSKTC